MFIAYSVRHELRAFVPDSCSLHDTLDYNTICNLPPLLPSLSRPRVLHCALHLSAVNTPAPQAHHHPNEASASWLQGAGRGCCSVRGHEGYRVALRVQSWVGRGAYGAVIEVLMVQSYVGRGVRGAGMGGSRRVGFHRRSDYA